LLIYTQYIQLSYKKPEKNSAIQVFMDFATSEIRNRDANK